jgi:hypothetical protein
MYTRELTVWAPLQAGLLATLSASAAPMDASKAHSRSVIQQHGIVPAEELRVAEYLYC